MSSIAYVSDEKMLRYHRLCCNRSILFWRLSTNRFTDFKPGDLLFFYSYASIGKRKKGFIGYGHYVSMQRLSIDVMWKRYGTLTGYDTKDQLKEAMQKASKGDLPKQISCLYLKDIVFFTSVVYPKDIGLTLPKNLESYVYLDKNDPTVTANILRQASVYGIDIWSMDPNSKPEEIFRHDTIKHIVGNISTSLKDKKFTASEKSIAKKLMKEAVRDGKFEAFRSGAYEVIHITHDIIEIGIPFVYNSLDYAQRLLEILGRMTYYRLQLKREGIMDKVIFTALTVKHEDELQKYIEELNEQL